MFIKNSVSKDVVESNVKGNYYVRLRATCMSKRTDLYTGINISKDDWSTKNRRIKQGKTVKGTPYHILNRDLDTMEQFIKDYFNDCDRREAIPQLNELKERFNHKFRQSPDRSSNEFYYLFDKFIKTTAETRRWDKNMVEKYKRIRERLYKYNPKLNFLDLSETTMNGIMREFSRTMYNDALEKTLFCFRRFVLWARNKNYPINTEFMSFNPKLPLAHKEVQYLTPNDLNKIMELPLEEGCALDVTRDLFLFQCNTALRYSDLRQLKKDEIIEQPDGTYALRKLTEKDNDIVYIPLTSTAERIYMKYKTMCIAVRHYSLSSVIRSITTT